MKWADHINFNDASKKEIAEFLKAREELAFNSLKIARACGISSGELKVYRAEWAAISSLLYAMGIN